MNLLDRIPRLLVDNELERALSHYPEDVETKLSKSERLLKLLNLYDFFIPTQMNIEIYNQIYFGLVRSFQRKQLLYGNNQMTENRKVINGKYLPKGINSGDCSLIVGNSGLGKTSSIQRAIELISNNENIIIEKPYMEIVPIMIVEASPISSIKGFLLDILRVLDNKIGTNYYDANNRSTISSDSLLGAVSNALLLHCGVLIIDEVDRLVGNKKSNTFIGFITELCNMSGVTIIFCGTNRAIDFFQSTEYLSRRGMGCLYRPMDYDEQFYSFTEKVFKYQLTLYYTTFSSEICRFIYQCSNGIPALIIQLLISAQQFAITTGYEKLDMYSLKKGYLDKMSIMIPYINEYSKKLENVKKSEKLSLDNSLNSDDKLDNLFIKTSQKAQKDAEIAIKLLSEHIKVVVIKL